MPATDFAGPLVVFALFMLHVNSLDSAVDTVPLMSIFITAAVVMLCYLSVEVQQPANVHATTVAGDSMLHIDKGSVSLIHYPDLVFCYVAYFGMTVCAFMADRSGSD